MQKCKYFFPVMPQACRNNAIKTDAAQDQSSRRRRAISSSFISSKCCCGDRGEDIRSFFRARQFENKRAILSQVYIPIGRLALKFLVENLEVAQENLGRNFFNTPYVAIVEKGGVYFETNDSFLRLERLYEEHRLGYLTQARRMTFGVEPLFAYYHFKMSEIKKLRQVYWGKLNEVGVDDLKESIPDVW